MNKRITVENMIKLNRVMSPEQKSALLDKVKSAETDAELDAIQKEIIVVSGGAVETKMTKEVTTFSHR